MMMMDYGTHQYAPSTMSSETLSGSCGSRTNRVRTIRLIRPQHGNLPPPSLMCRHGPSLGFSVRGGREHGTGFFVSHVEPGTEAYRQGLKVGDQIIRVNGFTVDDAVHKEVLQLVSNHTHLTLKVRSVGMIPVKDKKSDSLSWQIVSDINNSSLRSSPQLSEKIHDVRINIMVAPRSKLGCGICKGPEWKPGIFVQFTKESGIAREAGLRPGDQILSCNSVDFGDVQFNEAVTLMKTSRQLDLVVRKAAGSELFPGESSGYNSSASSVTGDQSPSWSDSKRLSIVREESQELGDRLKMWGKAHPCPIFKPTVISLSESGTTITNNGTGGGEAPPPPDRKTTAVPEPDSRVVVVDVHRSEEADTGLAKSASTSSFGSLASRASSTASSSLSSALCVEIQRRTEKKRQVEEEAKPSIDEQLQMNKIMKGVPSEKLNQHNKLMDEFKKAHRRMFKGSLEELRPQTNMDRLASSAREESRPADRGTTGHPPPPPPPPAAPSTLRKQPKPKAPPVPLKTSTLTPQPCPPPDYDRQVALDHNGQAALDHAEKKLYGRQMAPDSVEMASLESLRLTGGASGPPKPPDTYFKAALGGATLRRPVSVTIGEYPTGTLRRPGKLDFLAGAEGGGGQFVSELEQTLNRSNLRKRTESMENLLNAPQIKQELNGSVRISFNKNFAKSTNDLTNLESFSKAFANRVTINVQSMMEKKMDTLPSGILKNGTHKPLIQQKSITFGEMPTVINDHPLHVS